jgi:hypothetical protein
MRLLSLAATFTTLLAAQEPARNFTVPSHLKLIPPLSSPRSTLVPALPMAVLRSESPAAKRNCAIPLLNVLPPNVNPDPAMIVQPKVTSNMPQVIPPAPACDDARRP